MRGMYRLINYQLLKKDLMDLMITKAYNVTIAFDGQVMPLAFAA